MYRKASQNKIRVGSRQSCSPDERLFIGTVGINCLSYTRRCIDTVVTECNSVRFVYIDNGSTDENTADLKTWKKQNPDIDEFHLGFNGYNAGVGIAWNQLIKMALEWDATKIIICNNDIAFGPHTIHGLITAYDRLLDENPATVMVTATNHTKHPHNLRSIKPQWNNHEHPDFSCFMITPETVERIGLFSEDYEPAFFEDNDMHWRILLMGYKAWGTDWAPYSHIASRTRFENPDIITHQQYRENKIKFYRNMMTSVVDQEVADERYALWVADHPDDPHPNHEHVIKYADEKGLVSSDLKQFLEGITWHGIR